MPTLEELLGVGPSILNEPNEQSSFTTLLHQVANVPPTPHELIMDEIQKKYYGILTQPPEPKDEDMKIAIVRRAGYSKDTVEPIVRFMRSGFGVEANHFPNNLQGDAALKSFAPYKVIHWGLDPVNGCMNKKEFRRFARSRLVSAHSSGCVPIPTNVSPGQVGVIRPLKHCQGQHFTTFKNQDELHELVKTAPYKKGYYIAPLIEKQAELRAIFYQRKVVAVLEKVGGTGDVWTHSNGWSFKNVKRSRWDAKRLSYLSELVLTGNGISAMDILVDMEGNYRPLENNKAPGMEVNQDGTCGYVQRCVSACLLSRGRVTPLYGGAESWKDVIHPELLNEKTKEIILKGETL